MKELVILQNNTPLTTTKVIAENTGVAHRNIKQLIDRHEKDFTDFGTFKTTQIKEKASNLLDVYYLNEEQALFLITLMRNNKTVTDLKKRLVKQFVAMRKWITEQQTMKANEQYKITRQQSKVYRLAETAEIKKLVDYAKENGSKNADRYYSHFSNLAKAYFDIQITLKKKQNFRELLTDIQLIKIMFADLLIKQAIEEGLAKKMYYKDIYKLAKDRVVGNVKLIGGEEIVSLFTQLLEQSNSESR